MTRRRGARATVPGEVGLLSRSLLAVAAVFCSGGVAYFGLSEPMCERRDAQSSFNVKRHRRGFDEKLRFLSRPGHRRCFRHFRRCLLVSLFRSAIVVAHAATHCQSVWCATKRGQRKTETRTPSPSSSSSSSFSSSLTLSPSP